MKLNWKLTGWVLRSKNRAKVLRLLNIPLTPSQVAKKLKISLTHASKVVRELEKKKLIKCLNESNKMGRIYQRTSEGEKIKKYLDEVENLK